MAGIAGGRWPDAERAPSVITAGEAPDDDVEKGTPMAYVCSATWTALPGKEQTVRDALEHLSPASREEPGNILYQAYQSPDERRIFRIFEIYDDEDAFKAHATYPHFEQWALGQAIPALETRQRDFYETLDF